MSDAERVLLALTKRLNAHIKAESDRGFEVLAACMDEPSPSVTIARPFGISGPKGSMLQHFARGESLRTTT